MTIVQEKADSEALPNQRLKLTRAARLVFRASTSVQVAPAAERAVWRRRHGTMQCFAANVGIRYIYYDVGIIMGEYRLPIRLIIGGALITGLSVWFFLAVRDKELEELRNVGFALLIAGLGAFVAGIVLWPRSK